MSLGNLQAWCEDSVGPKILQMYAQKTSAAVIAAAESAAIIAKSSAHVREVCSSLASSFGVAFQIIDDIHNFSDAPSWGKERGEDLAQGKLTYLIYRALETLSGKRRERLASILATADLREDETVFQEGVDMVVSSGAPAECRHLATAIFEDAWNAFAESVSTSDSKIVLRTMCSKMLRLAEDV